MKQLKRFLFLSAIFLCFFTFTGLTRPPELTGPSVSDDTKPVILCDEMEMSHLTHWPNWKNLIIMEADAEIPLDSLSSMYYIDTNGNDHCVEINWNITDPALTSPGFHYITGTPILTENMSLADGFDGLVVWPMFRKGGADVITATPDQQPFYLYDQLIPLNSKDPASEIDIKTTGRRFNTGEDAFFSTDNSWIYSWDYSQVNTNKIGVYTVNGTILPPEWVSVPDEYCHVTFSVYVLPVDTIEILAPIQIMTNGSLVFKWIYDSTTAFDVILEQQLADGTWTACSKDWFRYHAPTKFAGGKLSLYLTDIPNGTYILRLRYQDMISGKTVTCISKAIHITIPENIAEILHNAGDTIPKELDIGGDRHGEDEPGTDMPDYNQNAPAITPSVTPEITPDVPSEVKPAITPDVPSDVNTVITSDNPPDVRTAIIPDDPSNVKREDTSVSSIKESVTDTSTAISGLRLRSLLDANDTVFFEKDGITLEIPSVFLSALQLTDYDLFEVTIIRPQKDKVQILASVNGEPLTELPNARLFIPWKSTDGTNIICRDNSGTQIKDTQYHSETELLQLTIHAPGTLTIQSQQDQAQTDAATSPAVIICVIILVLLLFASCLFLLQKRRRKRDE